MGDIMRPVPFKNLLTRIFAEYKESQSIFGIPAAQFYRKQDERKIKVFGETCETPIGPAAGPHTQLAQNIVTSWLTGGRFIELKTVQILDRLELEKPCIDAERQRWLASGQAHFESEKEGLHEQAEELVLSDSERAVESPVSGSIWQLAVAPGDRVQAGDTLLIIESMKMEIAVQALEAGTIVSIQREPGQQVKAGQCLLVLEVE